MSFEDFVSAIEHATGRAGKRQGRNVRLVCPAHDDHNPSLDVAEGDDGRPLVVCRSHACTFEAVCEAIGREQRDFLPARPEQGDWTLAGPAVAVYRYLDEHGNHLYDVCRTANKQFPQRRPDPDAKHGWRWNLQGVRRVLYRLPELAEAVARGEAIYVCEGEKDVEAVRKAGGAATCNPGGAGKWRNDYAKQLAGVAEVIVVADDDAPGRAHAHAVAESLRRAGIETTIVLPAKGKDAADHLAAGRGLDEFRPLEDVPGDEERRSFPGLSHAEALSREVPPTSELVEGLAELGTLGTVAGLPETYKSFLALALGLGVAGGGRVLGRAVTRTGPVAYWWQDDSEANELRRIQAYAAAHDLVGELPIRWHLNEGFLLPYDLESLREEIEREGQVLVVLDSLYNFLNGNVLKDEDVAKVYALLKREICDVTGCAILIVDHAPWPTDSNRGQRRAYGSVFKAAAIRWGIFLERQGEKLWVQASGNNLGGLKRSIVEFDTESLELRLVATPETGSRDIAAEIADYLAECPGSPKSKVAESIHVRPETVSAILKHEKQFVEVEPSLYGKPSNASCWVLADQAPQHLFPGAGKSGEEVESGGRSQPLPADVFPPFRGGSDGKGLETPLPDGWEAAE